MDWGRELCLAPGMALPTRSQRPSPGYNEELCCAFPFLYAFQGACKFYVLPVTNLLIA